MVRLRRTVILVGLMGVGKTSAGRRLAELLRVPFTDSDDEITAAANMSIPEIFASYGEPEFRALERRVISRLMESGTGVVATGGGAFCQSSVREDIRASGVSIWLKLLEVSDPKGALEALYEERAPVYEMADIHVETKAAQDLTAVAKNMLRALIAYDKASPEASIFETEVEP